jgi:elongation factor G
MALEDTTTMSIEPAASAASSAKKTPASMEIKRIKHLRNVGILAHVDAGKTTVTERMLALTGVVRSAGNVDDGNTVTDYLPAERERGITIQSAAISFDWRWHNNRRGDDYEHNDNVRIQLIDTPGHVDFSVEVNRSVAVLDGAILVVDAVAGVQAQTETVWRAITRPSWNNHADLDEEFLPQQEVHAHEPLPCLALINKMDKDGCHFGKAIQSLRDKLPGANPIPIQIPLFRGGSQSKESSLESLQHLPSNIIAVAPDDVHSVTGEFVGVVDLIHMRAILWPDNNQGVSNVENTVPSIVNLVKPESHEPLYPDCQVTQQALAARFEFIEALAEVDPTTEEYYLNDEEPSNAELRAALRRATLAHKAMPVMAAAALKGKGVEPLLDAVADLLPSPLDRIPPAITKLEDSSEHKEKNKGKKSQVKPDSNISLGHPLHPSLLALAFKVVHMKGRGGSGDGRVVFARIYSGKLRDGETVQVISPPAPGEAPEQAREERVGGMLELAGGRFDNVEGGICRSGDVCALVGLKTVVTGDTLLLAGYNKSSNAKAKKAKRGQNTVYLAGVASPKPVITVRLEAETSGEQTRLSEALKLMTIEDPSLVVEETESTTLLSGLGELHIEVTLDRLFREHGLQIMVGPPTVAYRETVKDTIETPGGLFEYDRTIGGTRLQGAVHLIFKPSPGEKKSTCILLSDPVVTVGPKAREFLGLNPELSEEDLLQKSDLARALIRGCQGALKRGPHKSAAMANLVCHVEDVDAEGGLAALKALPGALQAASAYAVAATLKECQDSCAVLEPTMSVEVILPNDMVGAVLSDLNGRRGTVGDVIVGDDSRSKSMIRGDVPLVEILGYANSLRSLTGGEGAFSAEYKGHSPS